MRKTFIAALVVTLSAFTVLGQTEVEMEEDAEKVHDIYEKVMKIKDFRMPSGVTDTIGKNYPNFQKALDGMTQTRFLQEEYGDFLNQFAKKYAPGETDWKISRALTAKFSPLKLDFNPGLEYNAIMDRFSYLETAGEENALIALKIARENGTDPGRLKALHEIYRVKAIEEAKSLLTIAPLFDPGNARIERRAAKLSAEVEEALKDYKAEEMKVLQSRTWKGNISGTSAGSPAALAAAGLRFMNGLSDWGGNTARGTKIKKVSIIGDWFVAERDALGRPTRYGLPAAVAVHDNTMASDVVTVYEISLVTKFPKMEPNFYGVWVGNVWRMLDKNLPK